MKTQRTILWAVALALIGMTTFGMHWLKANQKLGQPGIVANPIPGSPRMDIPLPERVLDYNSKLIPTATNLLTYLPHDTSFAQREYLRGEEYPIWLSVVMMGTDRTSIHKPQFCLVGSGWNIDDGNSSYDTIRVENPHPYDLPVMKLLLDPREFTDKEGQKIKLSGIYVYWFVADHELTASHWTRMEKMATHLLRTGELQRWAYVSCLGVCPPGQEDATYQQMKKFIAATVPKIQKTTNPSVVGRESESIRTASR